MEITRTRIKQTKNTTLEDWKSRLHEFNYSCAYCLQRCDSLQIEHMNPLSRDGSNAIDNIVPACKRCNNKKYNKNLIEFIIAGALLLQGGKHGDQALGSF